MDRTSDALRIVALALLLIAGAGTHVVAGSIERVQLFRKQGWLLVNLQARDLLDDRTVSTVESGLPGSCVYQIDLEDPDGNRIIGRRVELSIRLDLWEDHYVLGSAQDPIVLPTLASADSALSHVGAVRLLPLEGLIETHEYRLHVSVSVQPLAASDQARISRYVSQNTGGARQEFALNLSALFNRMFGQRGDAEGSPFRSTSFRPQQLEELP